MKLDDKLAAFEPIQHQTLTTDSYRPKQGKASGHALFAQIQAQGYRGDYSAAMSITSTHKDFHAWQLHIELEDVRPRVWRRLLVPLTIDLSRLHVMLLWATGWDGGHVHEFIFSGDHYGATEPGREFRDDLMPEEDVMLNEALGTSKAFENLYDFGNSW